MFENMVKFLKKFNKKEKNTANNSKDAAKERLHLVLMQDRANVSADFLELMKQEIIEVIKKYIEVDEGAIDVRLTNKENEDGTNGAPALYANIPILNIKNDVRKMDKKELKEEAKEESKQEEFITDNEKQENEQKNNEKQTNVRKDDTNLNKNNADKTKINDNIDSKDIKEENLDNQEKEKVKQEKKEADVKKENKVEENKTTEIKAKVIKPQENKE